MARKAAAGYFRERSLAASLKRGDGRRQLRGRDHFRERSLAASLKLEVQAELGKMFLISASARSRPH